MWGDFHSIHRLHGGTFHHLQLNVVLIVAVLIFGFITL